MSIKFDRKIIIAVFSIVLLIGALIWLSFFWQLGSIRKISDNIQKDQLDALVRQEKIQRIRDAEKEMENIEIKKVEMDNLLVSNENAVILLKTLEEIAAETENSIKISVLDPAKLKTTQKKTAASQTIDDDDENVKDGEKAPAKTDQQKEKKEDFSGMLGFTIEITGRFSTLLDFLTKVENMPFFVRIYKFETAPALKNASNSTIDSTAIGENKNISSTITILVYTNGKK